MINNVSWSQYWTVIAAIGALYYFFILAVYFRKDLLTLPNRKFNFKNVSTPDILTDSKKVSQRAGVKQLDEKLSNLIEELKAFIQQIILEESSREQLLQGVQRVLAKHYDESLSQYKDAINNIINTECSANKIVHLSDVELGNLWRDR